MPPKPAQGAPAAAAAADEAAAAPAADARGERLRAGVKGLRQLPWASWASQAGETTDDLEVWSVCDVPRPLRFRGSDRAPGVCGATAASAAPAATGTRAPPAAAADTPAEKEEEGEQGDAGVAILTDVTRGYCGLHDQRSGEMLVRYAGNTRHVYQVAVHPSGDWVSTTCFDGHARLYCIATGDELACTTRDRNDSAYHSAWAMQGQRLLLAWDRGIVTVHDTAALPHRDPEAFVERVRTERRDESRERSVSSSTALAAPSPLSLSLRDGARAISTRQAQHRRR